MKPSLQWLRMACRTFILLSLIAVPVLVQYRRYLDQGMLEEVLESQTNSPQKMGLQLTHALLREDSSKAKSKAAAESLSGFRGNTWSGSIFGIRFMDPLAALEISWSARGVTRVVLTAVLLPLILTLLLGRVFCSWICPAGFLFEISGKFRGLLARLGNKVGDRHFKRRNKYVLLAAGLVMSTLIGLPLLSSFYPPALLVADLQGQVDYMYGQTEPFTFSLGGLTTGFLFCLGLVFFEWFVSKRAWCRYFCPGGALYSLLGARRLWRVRRNKSHCTDCGDCTIACPMALNPMKDSTGLECDNCLACVSACPEKGALGLNFSQKETPQMGYSSNPELTV